MAPCLWPNCGGPLPRWPSLPRRPEDHRHLWFQHSRACVSAARPHSFRDQICTYVFKKHQKKLFKDKKNLHTHTFIYLFTDQQVQPIGWRDWIWNGWVLHWYVCYLMTWFKLSGGWSIITKAAYCSLTGVTVLIWDRNESMISDRYKEQEETSTIVDRLRGQRRRQQPSSRDRKGPTADTKLKKKLASLEQSETKTKTKSGCTKQKQGQMKMK